MSKDKLVYKNDGTVDFKSPFYKDTRVNGKLVSLEDIIEETYNRALTVIDDALYELLDDADGKEDQFYMDYKEAFGHVVEQLNKFHNVED
jgi:Tfp pilus assembly ATPase PilU